MNKITPAYLQYPASFLKENLLRVCKNYYRGNISITRYPKEINRIYQGNSIKYLMFYLAEQWFMENGKVETFDTIFDPTIQADWSKVCIEAAMYSWLVIDRQDSLNKHFPDDPTVPTELSYGLVLDYFEPVMRMGCFLCQYTFKEELEGMDKSVIEDAHQYALEETIKKLSDTQSTEDIIERATRLKQTYLTTILPF